MPFFELSYQVGLLILNIAVASILIGLVAIFAGRLARSGGLPTRHGLYCMLILVWAGGSVWFLMKLMRGMFVVRRLRRSLRPSTDPRVVNALLQAIPGAGQSINPPVFESQMIPAPLTLGLSRSVIVIPDGLAEALSEDELTCVLAHEVAHVRRYDTTIAFLQQLAVIGFWWNPLLHIINRRIGQLREQICDDHVVQQRGGGLPLAEAIVKVAEWSVGRNVTVPLTITLLDDVGDMEQRIMRLMKPARTLATRLNLRSAVLVGLFGVLLAAIPLIPVVRAQVASPETAAPEKVTTQIVKAKTVAADVETGEWRVRIHAVDQDGNPIPNPQIGVRTGSQKEPDWQTGSRDGTFTVTLPTRRQRYCYLLARASGYAPMRAFWGRNQSRAEEMLPAELTFQMTKAITVGGTVVDEDDQPIANASVMFSASSQKTNPAQRPENSFYDEKYVTDQQGRWRCDLAPSNISDASIKVSHTDYASQPSTFDQTKQIPELRKLTHSWTLKKGFVITGHVVDTEGEPVTGAILGLGELNTSSQDGPFARTDAEGWYRFERVSPQHDLRDDNDPIRFTITILKRGYMPVMESVPGYGNRPLGDSTEQKRVMNFTLKPGVKVKLHVVDSQDQPVSGAWVMLNNWHDTTTLRVLQSYELPATTDEAGNWEWDNAPPDELISYDLGKSGYAMVQNLRITASDAETKQTVILNEPQLITGNVIDAKTRQPISEFVVERAFERVAGHPEGLYWTSDLARGKNGVYQMRVTMPGSGRYTYRAQAKDYETAVSKSTPFKPGKTTLNFELQPQPAAGESEGADANADSQVKDIAEQNQREADKAKSAVFVPKKNTISGRIVNQQKLGIGGATVALVAFSNEEMQNFSGQGRVITETIADSLGNYSLQVPAEEMKKRDFATVWAKAKGHVAARSNWSTVISALTEKKRSELPLSATQGTWVEVLDAAGAPLAGVRVIPRSIGVPRGVGHPLPKKWEKESTGTTDENGKAHLPHVDPGALKGIVLIPPGDMGSMSYNQNFFLNVRPAEMEPHFKLQLPETGSVKGQLVVAEGFGLPQDLQFRLESVPYRPPGFQHIVDVPVAADGTFSVDKLAVGPIFVPAFLPEDQPLRADVAARIKVKANKETQLNIPVAPGVKVQGRIQKSDTQENVRNYEMTLIYGQSISNRGPDFGWLSFEVVTDAEGRFECIVPPGPINLRMNRIEDGYAAVTSWLPREQRGTWGMKFDIPDQESFDLGTIELVKNERITGKVVDLNNRPLVDWSVYGFPKVPNFTQWETMNSMAGVHTNKEGIFNGRYPQTYPPAYWRVSHRVWETKHKFKDLRYVARVISHKPFILQIDTSKEWTDGEPIPYDLIPLSEPVSATEAENPAGVNK